MTDSRACVQWKSLLLVLACAGLFAACGGGSGGSSAPISPTGPSGSAPEPSTYGVGGTVTGLASGGLILQNNAGPALTLQADGPYSFPARLVTGASYLVTVQTNPPGQSCVVDNASGSIANTNVTNVAITCTTPAPGSGGATPLFTVGGTIGGLTRDGLVLRLRTEDIAIPSTRTNFVFAAMLAQNSAYDVSVVHQPQNQTCQVSGGSGQVANASITNVAVTCSDNPPPGVLSLDKNSLTFVAEEGEHIDSQSIVGTITGTTEPVFVNVRSTYNGIMYAYLTLLTEYSGRVDVAVRHTEGRDVAPGTYNDTITVEVCFDAACIHHLAGSPRQIPVTYTVTRTPLPVLQLSDQAVAFASVPHAAQLTRSISVSDASGASSTWSATTSGVPWLAVTPAGASGSSMTLTAEPIGLADGFYEALVTVRSSNPAITQDAILRVSLYKSGTASAATLAQMPSTPDYFARPAPTASVSDPLRPILYSIAGTQVSIDHFYSGAHLGDLSIQNAVSLGTSRDGSRLYVLNNAPQLGVAVVNLDSRQVIHSYPLPAQYSLDGPVASLRLTSAQVGGRSVLILNGVRAPVNASEESIVPLMDADTGEVLGETHYATSELRGLFAVSRDSRSLYSTETGVSGNLSIDRFELRANILGNVYAKFIGRSPEISVANSRAIATSNDGSRSYVAYYSANHGQLQGFAATASGVELAPDIEFDLPPEVLSVGLSPRNIEFDAYGKLIANLYTHDFRVYGANGVVLQHSTNLPAASIGSAATGTLKISSDGLRAVGNGYLVNLPP